MSRLTDALQRQSVVNTGSRATVLQALVGKSCNINCHGSSRLVVVSIVLIVRR